MAASTARSFLQVAAKKEVATPLRVVQIDGLVVLKILKHCKEFEPALVSGQLLGLDVGSVLEVTNCFPIPLREEDQEEDQEEIEEYQLDMLTCFREVNVDSNTVGWYQSTQLGCYPDELIKSYIKYKERIERCVGIIYDPTKSHLGVSALKAMKLSDSFMELIRSQNFTGEKLREKNFSWADLFEEVPIKISNSALINAFMTELESDSPVTQGDFDRLQLSTNPYMEKSLHFLSSCMDTLASNQQNLQFYYRNLSRQQAQQQSWLQNRRAENAARRAAGEEPLPEEDPSLAIFKPLAEPDRLESYLVTNQAADYCNGINSIAGQSFSRMYLMKALHSQD